MVTMSIVDKKYVMCVSHGPDSDKTLFVESGIMPNLFCSASGMKSAALFV